jgi:hypothetical protein
MSHRKLGRKAVALAALVMVVFPRIVAAQEPSLSDVLARTAAYVADFQHRLSGIVAEETYAQDARIPWSVHRELKSDLLLVRPVGADRYVEYRDVFEVDGSSVRDRQERLTALFIGRSAPSASQQIERIITDSARYNIGNIERTINIPTLPLLFLNRVMQTRFKFTRATDSAPSTASRARPTARHPQRAEPRRPAPLPTSRCLRRSG